MGEELARLVHHYGYGVVGVVIFLESMGLPLPGESLLIASAVYAATHGGLGIEWVVLAAAIGAILGDNTGYLIGQWGGTPALRRWGPKVGLTEQRQVLGWYLFRKHGPKVVFFGRFTAILRTFAALLAGAIGMEWRRFLVWNALGAVVWTAGYGFGAFLLGRQIKHLLGPLGLVLGAIAVGVVVWSWVFIRRNEARLVAEAEAEMARSRRPEPRGHGAVRRV